MLEAELKKLIVDQGGIRPGVARREAFKDSPPSADMTYLKPWAESVISFAMTAGTDWMEDYFGKVERMTMRDNMYHIYHNIYGVAEAAAEHLKLAGYKAHAVIPNGLYRPDHTFEKELPDDDVLPPLSLRYMAVGAGVGVFGWSGNVMVPGYHSNVYLGAVLTDAKLTPDSLLEEDLCDGCRICASVCPVEFIDKKESVIITIAGREFSYNKKRGDLKCVIGCGGYTGLAPNGMWSSWSTGRTPMPDDPAELPELFARLRDDPANAAATKNLTFGARGVLDRPKENIRTTCNNCITVCSGPLKRRKELRDLLFRSGVVELDDNGQEVVVKSQ